VRYAFVVMPLSFPARFPLAAKARHEQVRGVVARGALRAACYRHVPTPGVQVAGRLVRVTRRVSL